LNGSPIDAEKFIASYEDVIPFIEMVDARSVVDGGPLMTYFEVLVAVAYAAFADAPVDVAVVEVGMGGSWDATNVVNAQVAVVTPIAVDHERFLGPSVEGIATEKGGIIKDWFCGGQRPAGAGGRRDPCRASAGGRCDAGFRGQRVRHPAP
jgi:dihydrofolate synthase/folylpolyglutamate synthase